MFFSSSLKEYLAKSSSPYKISSKVEHLLKGEARYCPDFLLHLSPSYANGRNIQQLADEGILHPEIPKIFRRKGTPIILYKHQEEAILLAQKNKSYVVTSGSGSGKSLTYFIPIFNSILTKPAEGKVSSLSSSTQ